MSRIEGKAKVVKAPPPCDASPDFGREVGRAAVKKYAMDRNIHAPWRNGDGDVVDRAHFKIVAENMCNYRPKPAPPEQGPGTQRFHQEVNRTKYPNGMLASSDGRISGLRDAIRRWVK
jgi:hypothetical protein